MRTIMNYDIKDHIEQLLKDEINPSLAMHGGYAGLAGLKPLGDSWEVSLELGLGKSNYWLWTCDLSPEYVTSNGNYRG